MTVTGWLQIIALVAVLTALTPLLGGYMARVYQGDRVALARILGPVERAAYRVFAADRAEQGWVMMLGRFVPILAVLALAGSLGPRRVAPPGLGTLRTDTTTFVVFLVGFVAIFAVLTFLAVLFLAPFADALSSHMLN